MADKLTAAEKLIKLYESAQKHLNKIITDKSIRGFPAAYERRMLAQVNAEIRRIRKATPEVIKQLVLEGYQEGLDQAINDIAKAIPNEPPAIKAFSRLDTREINLLTQNTIDELDKALNIVGRRMQDEIRQAGLNATAYKKATGATVKEMQKDLEKRLLGLDAAHPDGRIGIRYRNGRIVPLDTYTKMVSRTTSAEAQNKAVFIQAKEMGQNLVKLTSHPVTCEVCAKYQGRIYALTKEVANGKYKGPDGEPLRFPLLYETVLHHGYETIHPNCRHRFRIFVAAFYPPEKLKEFSDASMKPFKDSRSDRDRKAYATEQAQNRIKNQDYRQYQKYKAALGEDAPKSFSGFRAMKKAGGEKWGDLQGKYRNHAKALDVFNTGDIPKGAKIHPQEILNDMNTSSIGSETLKYIDEFEIRPKLDYSPKSGGVRGQEFGGDITLYLNNCKDVKTATCTLIHECTHKRYGIGQSQWAECVCVCQEIKHRRNRAYLTIQEKRTIIEAVKDVYPEYNWRKGGIINGRRTK